MIFRGEEMMKRFTTRLGILVLIVSIANVLAATSALGQTTDLPRRDLSDLPSYKQEYKVVGGFRIFGSELKGAIEALVTGFKKYHQDAKISTNFMTSSEGAMAGLYTGNSDPAPSDHHPKITY